MRNKYVDPTNKEAGVLMGELPDNVKGKRTATVETLSQVVINKYVDRTRKQFSRLGADIATSTLNDFCAHVANDLKPLYDLHLQEVLIADTFRRMRREFQCGIRSKVKHRARIILAISGCTLRQRPSWCLWMISRGDPETVCSRFWMDFRGICRRTPRVCMTYLTPWMELSTSIV